MHTASLHYVPSRLEELGVVTILRGKETELLARFLRQDEKINAAFYGTYRERVDDLFNGFNGFIVLTEQHIVFAGRHGKKNHTSRLPLDEVSRVVPLRLSGGIRVYYTTSTTNRSFQVTGAGSFEAVTDFANEFDRLKGKLEKDPANEVPRTIPSVEPSRTKPLAKGESPSATEEPRESATNQAPPTKPDPETAGSPEQSDNVAQAMPPRAPEDSKPASTGATPATPKSRQTTTTSSSSKKSQPGEGKLAGCLGVVAFIVIIVVIVGLISDACSGDDSGNLSDRRRSINDIPTPTPIRVDYQFPTPTPSSLSPVQQGAFRDAQTYGLDAIAAANGISDATLADLMVRETAYVLRALEQFAGNRQRYDLVWGSCYHRDVHPHRPRALRSGLATYCGDVVDSLR